ncbi:protein EI24 homolog isoform X3 [Lycium barbarum]|uniref:protein EI24 homolog isoform X3 n=1 Tax=Lycium barbarum TaxID=112863 RepID=UPI00293ED4BD|nr:protein EI24 homolog isoform X3 [Lycium barbarum]
MVIAHKSICRSHVHLAIFWSSIDSYMLDSYNFFMFSGSTHCTYSALFSAISGTMTLLNMVFLLWRIMGLMIKSYLIKRSSKLRKTQFIGKNQLILKELCSCYSPVVSFILFLILCRVMISIAEQLYSVLLLTFFFVEVYVTGFIPYIGKALNFMLLSWLYAYYCFEYKWNLSGLSLDKRLDFFESNWAFFAGFGNPCVLAIFLFSPLVSCGVMAILFPLFVLTATGSEADKIVALPRRKWKGAGLGRVPIFFIADYMSMRVLKLFSLKSRQQMKENKAL